MSHFDNLQQINSNNRIEQFRYVLELDAINERREALLDDFTFDQSIWIIDRVIKHRCKKGH